MTDKTNWGIARKTTVALDEQANTTASRYPLRSYTMFRRFRTRSAARQYKQSLRNPQSYVIVDHSSGMAVR